MSNFGYRYQYSFRHFVGNRENRSRQRADSEVKNTVHQLELGLQYGWDKQTTVSMSIPYVMAERSQNDSSFPGERRQTSARGFGDFSIIARRWLLDVDTHPDTNLELGLGVKFPTGQDNVQDSFKSKDSSGKTVTDTRTVDQSIQPGDGGWGLWLTIQGFTRIGDFVPYAAGSYLFTPEQKNGVYTSRSKAGEEIMSIADQYVARAGTMYPVEWIDGLSAGFGLRIEGIPVRDILGQDEGFRRPGYAISWEPSLVYGKGKDTFSFNLPIAWLRNRSRSVADQTVGGHGDAAFADYVVLLGWSHHL